MAATNRSGVEKFGEFSESDTLFLISGSKAEECKIYSTRAAFLTEASFLGA
jgi:hypothetical protein